MTTFQKNIFISLLFLSFSAPTRARFEPFCIWGNCNNGQGIKLVDYSTYYIGSFSKGKMEGRGMIASFKMVRINEHLRETDTAFLHFLNIPGLSSKQEGYLGIKKNNKKYFKRIGSGFRTISPQEVLSFQPAAYYSGNFEKGKLEGSGTYFAKKGLFSKPAFEDIFKNFLTSPLLQENAQSMSATYEGNFSGGKIVWKGKVEVKSNDILLLFDVSGDNNSDTMKYLVKKEPGEPAGFVEEMHQQGQNSGWITTNITNLVDLINNKPVQMVTGNCRMRMLFYGSKLLGQMPCEQEENAKARTEVVNKGIPSGKHLLPYTGQVNDAGIPDGFGCIRYNNNISYTGYFLNGQREGPGEYIHRDQATGFLNGHYIGYFSADNFIQGISDIVGGVNNTYREYTWRDVENVYVPEQAAWIGKGVARHYVMSWSKLKSGWETINRWTYEGYFKNNIFHGVGSLTDQSSGKKEQGIFREGKLAQGSRKYNAGGLMYGWVVSLNGRKVCVVSQREYDPVVTFSDGTKLAKTAGEFEVLSYDNAEFKCKCTACDNGIVTSSTYDPGKTVDQWYTKYTPMYPGSSFERVETTRTTTTVGNRLHVYKTSCTKCWGTGKVVCKSSLPLGK